MESVKQIRKCVTCGHVDNYDFCSKCGSPLSFEIIQGESYIRYTLNFFGNLTYNFLYPFLIYLKTLWVALFKSTRFFRALFRNSEPVDSISFPLTGLWRFLRDEKQPILSASQFFVASSSIVIFVTIAFPRILDFKSIEFKNAYLNYAFQAYTQEILLSVMLVVMLLVAVNSAFMIFKSLHDYEQVNTSVTELLHVYLYFNSAFLVPFYLQYYLLNELLVIVVSLIMMIFLLVKIPLIMVDILDVSWSRFFELYYIKSYQRKQLRFVAKLIVSAWVLNVVRLSFSEGEYISGLGFLFGSIMFFIIIGFARRRWRAFWNK